MKRCIFSTWASKLGALVFLLLLASSPLHAQLVADSATNTLSNVTNTLTGNVTVGTNGSFTLLALSNNTLVTNSATGLIGNNSTARSNEVQLVSPTGRWSLGGGMPVGNSGSFNRLVVSNGAKVFNNIGLLSGQSSASNNIVLVTGAGSTWSNRSSLNVGNSGAGNNRLLIEAGGQVFNTDSLLGGSGVSSNDIAVVTGSGSLWNNAGNLYVGYNGSYNTLLVSNGSVVISSNGTVGNFSEARFNLATVTGSGSLWSNRAAMYVGQSSSGNQLVVGNGATAFAGGSAVVGLNIGANSNSAIVTDAGSSWRVTGDLYVGSNSPFNGLTVANAGFAENSLGRVGYLSTSSNNLVLVTGTGSVWSNRSDLTVGFSGPGNQMIVANGGWVANRAGRLGAQLPASNNLVQVSGSGSMWSNSLGITVGGSTPGNRLVIESGGSVHSSGGAVGDFDSASNNEARVTGPGSLWTNNGNLTIGNQVGFNRLVISNGAAVQSVSGTLGTGNAAISNQVLVTGTGSLWSNRTTLVIGGSVGNRANVTSGGWLADKDGFLGGDFDANSNSVTLFGGGSGWNNLGTLYVGYGGSRNTLLASNGASVLSSNAFIGESTSLAHSNLALLTGVGTLWSNRFDLTIGNHSTGNRLEVRDGAQMFTGGDGFVSKNTTAISNSVLVSGPGASWVVASNLFLGSNGAGARLVVTNGSRAVSGVGFLDGQNTEVLVTGAGSAWSNRFDLHMGGTATRLSANDGGTVSGSNLFFGEEITSTNNRVTVNGGTLRASAADGSGFLDVRRGTNVLNDGVVDVDKLVLTNKGNQIRVLTGFVNNTSNAFGFEAMVSSTISVAGTTGVVTKVSVTLSNLSRFRPDELDFLLVSPAGQKVMFMSDAGGTNTIFGVGLSFDDAAASFLPDSAAITPGTYRPTDYEPGDNLPSPAPNGPYSTNLSSFNGSSPNGIWTLYVNKEDTHTSGGSLLGWGLQIETEPGTFGDAGTLELNGGTLVTRGAVINNGLPFVVGGPGGVPAIWEARAGLTDNSVARDLLVGNNSSFNQLVIPSGAVVANTNVIVGASPSSSNNLLHITGGTLRVLNPNTVLDVRGGTNRIDAGLVDLLHLVVTNTGGQFEMFGGTLRTPDTIISNGRVCIIGGGASLATLQLLGGTHTFANNLTVATNGSLIGTGMIDGTVTVAPGGRLTPGAPIGSMNVLGSVILQGTVNLQIDKSGGVRTSDEVVADGAIFYNGALNVTDIGTDVLASGDRFFLFDATPYVGAFTTLNLPPLGAGLAWQNNLLFDGSIEVVSVSLSQPTITGLSLSGTNLILSGTNGVAGQNFAALTATNVTTPAANWQSLVTNQFGAGGQFSFTNAINRNERQRYFRLRTP